MNPRSANSASTTKSPLAGRNIKIGAQPIIWSNDDFQELGGDIPLKTCLGEMKAAGYAGTELGHKFPKDPEALARTLEEHGLELVSGWHSTFLSSEPLEGEIESFKAHLKLLKTLGCKTAIAAECAGRIYTERGASLFGKSKPVLDDDGWKKLASGLDRLAELAAGEGMTLAYHHHMGTVVQDESEIDRLMRSTKKAGLLFDAGHLAFAGADPLKVISRYRDRVAHVHLKDVRSAVVEAARSEGLSFEAALMRGVFTVPGDGAIDFAGIFSVLAEADYEGWMVVEAEQDPKKAPPLEYARKGREYVRVEAGL